MSRIVPVKINNGDKAWNISNCGIGATMKKNIVVRINGTAR